MGFKFNKFSVLKKLAIIGVVGVIVLTASNKDKQLSLVSNMAEFHKVYNMESLANQINNKQALKQYIEVTTDENDLQKAYYLLGIEEALDENYVLAQECFYKALSFTTMNQSYLTLSCYDYLSEQLMQMKQYDQAESYFIKAEELALELKEYNYLSRLYYKYTKQLLNREDGVVKAFKWAEKGVALQDYGIDKIEVIDHHMMLCYLYMASNQMELSMSHIMQGLELAYEINDKSYISKCVINLAYNYQVQERYDKAVSIYLQFLNGKDKPNIMNQMIATGYLAECFAKLSDFRQADYYAEQYLEKIKLLPEDEQPAERVWIYTLMAENKALEGSVQSANVYLRKAEEEYETYITLMYPNMKLWLEKVELDIIGKSNQAYTVVLEGYKALLKKIEDQGMEIDIRLTTLDSIINLSKQNKDYETLVYYMEIKNETLIGKKEAQFNEAGNIVLGDFSDYLNQRREAQETFRETLRYILIGTFLCIAGLMLKHNRKITKLNKQLALVSVTDMGTNTYNKRYLYDKLYELKDQQKKIYFMMLDIDFFKQYNDNYGHMEGDLVLRQIGELLKEVFKEDIVARYGGEEFSVISIEEKEVVIEKIKKLQKQLHSKNIIHRYSEVSDRLTMSIGGAEMVLKTEADIHRVIKKADKNLYASKMVGRNIYTL